MLREESDLRGRWALVTGASAGIGKAYAQGLARRGCNVILVARRRELLETLAADLQREHGISAVPMALDLSGLESFDTLRAKTSDIQVDILINNAGFATYGPISAVSPQNDRRQIDVNVSSAVELCHMFIPPMIERRLGMVINVSSIASFQPVPYMPVYGASKAFLRAYSDALWFECKQHGVAVHATCPGATDTEWFDVVGNRDETLFGKPVDPMVVVDQSLKDALRGRPSTVVGTLNTITTELPRLLPKRLVIAVSGRQTTPRSQSSVPSGGMAKAQNPRG